MSKKCNDGLGYYKKLIKHVLMFLSLFAPAFEVFAISNKSTVVDNPETEIVQMYSYGASTCDEILLYAERELVKKTIKIWVGGYLSGVSVLLDKNYFNMAMIDMDKFFDEVILHCRNNPSDTFIKSASSILANYINE